MNLRQNNLGNFGENNIGIVKNLLNTNKVKSQILYSVTICMSIKKGGSTFVFSILSERVNLLFEQYFSKNVMINIPKHQRILKKIYF